MRDVLVGDYLRGRGVSRRSLLKFCAGAASWMALPPTMAKEIAAAIEKARRLARQVCPSSSMLRRNFPDARIRT